MRRLPLFPTLLVGLAVAIMISLGFWQLSRLHEKQAQLAQLASAPNDVPIDFPTTYSKKDISHFLFRKASGYCALVTDWSAIEGHNTKGQSGWKHIANCFTGEADAVPMPVDMGWSTAMGNPTWDGGQVSGIITEGSNNELRLIADTPAPGLQPSAVPTIESVDNPYKGGYWLFWFCMAPVTLIIYFFALRRRRS